MPVRFVTPRNELVLLRDESADFLLRGMSVHIGHESQRNSEWFFERQRKIGNTL